VCKYVVLYGNDRLTLSVSAIAAVYKNNPKLLIPADTDSKRVNSSMILYNNKVLY